MDLETVAVGTELLLGHTRDSNTSEICEALAAVGAHVVRSTVVPDHREQMRDAIRGALARTGAVIVTGGLGPTPDDLTREVAAEIFDVDLVEDPEVASELERRARESGTERPRAYQEQARVPRGSLTIPNRWGTAVGSWLEGEPGIAVLLPGVPRELRVMLDEELVPLIRSRIEKTTGKVYLTRSAVLRTSGITESELAELLGGVEEEIQPATMAFLPSVEGVDLRITVWREPVARAGRLLDEAYARVRPIIAEWHYGNAGADLAQVVVDELRSRSWRLGVAESCTGGQLGARLTAVAGASDVFDGAVVSYSNAVKIDQLGVDPATIAEEGAVSETVARQMAEGAAMLFDTDVAAGVTGIAGPGGGSPEKPVGTVWIAATVRGRTGASRYRFRGDRDWVRGKSAQEALMLMRRMILSDSSAI